MSTSGHSGSWAPQRGSIQTQAIILIVVGFLCGATVPAIFGIIALVQMDSDPFSAQRMNKVGWIVLAVIAGLIVLAVLATILIPLLVGGAAVLGA